jgi:hypothetical protein
MNVVCHRDRWTVVAAALYAIFSPAVSFAADDGRFEKLSVYLERNIQDNDAEVRVEVTGSDDGLAALKVLAPGGRTVIDLRSPDSKLGIRGLALESPEPADHGSVVRADFPEGTYRFEATTTKGTNLRGETRLSHTFPAPAAFEYPQPDQKDVPAAALTLRWLVPEGIEFCTVVIEQMDSPYEIRAHLPGSAKALAIPEGFLRAGQDYKFAIGTVAKDGNRSFIEARFSTAGAQ